MSFIYKDIDLSLIELESIGYFKPKKDFETIVPGTNHTYYFNKDKPITKETLIVYFPGAFSYTHIGHLKLIKEAYESLISDDVRIVISPANSDYLYSKYGSNINVTNVKRFNRLLNTIEDNKEFLGESYNNLIIDLNPMLNMTCDYNFTDLLKNFIEVSGFNYESLPTPYILCGKDRGYFKDLTEHTDKIKVFYYKGSSTSSRNFVTSMGTFNRKDVLVRVHSEKQFEIFKKYMFPFYNSIKMSLISSEIDTVNQYLLTNPIEPVYTNCKDYLSTGLKYIPISRKFKHPLDIYPTIICKDDIPSGSIIIDSDVFSGTTKDFVNDKFNSKIVAVYDYQKMSEYKDIVDIDDIIKEDFNYPQVDVSERIGIQLFTEELHSIFNDLKAELKQVSI